MVPVPAPRIGLVPFYLKLYDDIRPEMRNHFEGFLAEIATAFQARGVAVSTAPICRVADEFDAALRAFEETPVDGIVTLHLAYSPSLESLETICRTPLPVLILDTSMDADFGLATPPDRLMVNHGIHGVMDFASMLHRRNRPYEIVAGHLADGRMMDRAADVVRGLLGANSLRNARALRLGDAFAGMGDFAVDETVLADRFGLTVDQAGVDALDAAVRAVDDRAVSEEIARDRERFACELDEDAHRRSVRVGLGLRQLLERGGYGGFSVNFQAFDRTDRPADTMPFLEISKAMERGFGYAGEGDVLTASLVGALTRAFGEVTFTEIFCADWTGGTLFLSHMGEINPALAADTPRIVAKPAFDGRSLDPAVLTCAAKPGPAVFVNLAPGPDDRFSLIVAPVDVVAEDDSLAAGMRETIRMWIRPRCDVAAFLETYSRAGGTHHSALVLGERAEAIAAFGRTLGVDVVPLG